MRTPPAASGRNFLEIGFDNSARMRQGYSTSNSYEPDISLQVLALRAGSLAVCDRITPSCGYSEMAVAESWALSDGPLVVYSIMRHLERANTTIALAAIGESR